MFTVHCEHWQCSQQRRPWKKKCLNFWAEKKIEIPPYNETLQGLLLKNYSSRIDDESPLEEPFCYRLKMFCATLSLVWFSRRTFFSFSTISSMLSSPLRHTLFSIWVSQSQNSLFLSLKMVQALRRSAISCRRKDTWEWGSLQWRLAKWWTVITYNVITTVLLQCNHSVITATDVINKGREEWCPTYVCTSMHFTACNSVFYIFNPFIHPSMLYWFTLMIKTWPFTMSKVQLHEKSHFPNLLRMTNGDQRSDDTEPAWD